MPVTREHALKNIRLGTAFEYRQLRKLKKACLQEIACRSSGSHGLFDLWGLTKKKLRLISVKRNGYTDPTERNQLKAFLLVKPDFVQVECHIYTSPKKIRKIKLRTAKDVDKLNKVRSQH